MNPEVVTVIDGFFTEHADALVKQNNPNAARMMRIAQVMFRERVTSAPAPSGDVSKIAEHFDTYSNAYSKLNIAVRQCAQGFGITTKGRDCEHLLGEIGEHVINLRDESERHLNAASKALDARDEWQKAAEENASRLEIAQAQLDEESAAHRAAASALSIVADALGLPDGWTAQSVTEAVLAKALAEFAPKTETIAEIAGAVVIDPPAPKEEHFRLPPEPAGATEENGDARTLEPAEKIQCLLAFVEEGLPLEAIAKNHRTTVPM